MNHKAKKSLGQNFLKGKQALSAIVDAGDVKADDIVLEIGPGKGVLTERLLMLAGKVIAIEKDHSLVEMLSKKFEKQIAEKKLDLVEGDILDLDPHILSFYKNFPYKIIANIPYYITGAIIRLFLEAPNKPETMVLLVQKEVAERIVAKDKKESILSLSVKVFGRPKYIEKVSKKYFSPVPKVDSAIIGIYNIGADIFSKISQDLYFKVIKAGFAHKRKFLLSNLEKSGLDGEKLSEIFQNIGISIKARPEDVPFELWIDLVKKIEGRETE